MKKFKWLGFINSSFYRDENFFADQRAKRFLSQQKSVFHFKIIFIFLSVFLFNQCTAASHHYNTNMRNIAQQILLLTDQEKLLNKKITQLSKEQEAFQKTPPKDYQQAIQLRNQIQMRLEISGMLVDELTQSSSNIQQRATKLEERQKNLQVKLLNEQSPDEKAITTHQLNVLAELIVLNQKQHALLVSDLALAQQLNAMYQQYWHDALSLVESINKERAIQVLRQQVISEQKSMDFWLKKMNELNGSTEKSTEQKVISQSTNTDQATEQKNLLVKQIVDESHLFYYSQQINLSTIRITVFELAISEKKTLEDFKALELDSSNSIKISELKTALYEDNNTLEDSLAALSQYQQLMKRQEVLLLNSIKNHWLNTNSIKNLKQNLDELESSSALLQKELIKKQEKIKEMQLTLAGYTSKLVAKRQAILQTDENILVGFLNQLTDLPKLLKGYTSGLLAQVWHGIAAQIIWFKLLVGLILTLSGFIWWIGRKYFCILSEKMSQNRQRTAFNILYILSELFYRNCGSLCLFLDAWMLLTLSGINFDAYAGLFYTAMIWFTFRVIMGVARIILVELGNNTEGHDVSFYHRLKWVFIIGGWVTVLVVLSKQLGMRGVIFDISNRLFMAFLLVVSIELIRSRNVIPSLLDPLIAHRKYLSHTVRTVCWILPFCFFVSTALGLLGYINLAWLLIYYQAALVLIVAGYMILRGIATDLFDISSEFMIKRLSQGWLWSEAFLKPLDRIFGIILFLSMIVSIFFVLGWHHDSLVVMKMREVFNYSFFYFSGMSITLLSIIELIVLVSFCVWSAKWTREFSYRWVFRNAKDIGIRNSLAVFCQYMVISLGTVITLRTLGIDFTGLSMILGGLAVGLGFGLRDLASNIVGGIMLLIERSVKEGDIVSIGTYEGEVMHIGIRAMRLRSWDFMEIMVPNSEILLKTFVNWTHQNGVVRTVIPMKIHRVDDPIMVQQIILDELKKIPEVLFLPLAEVFYTNLDSALIEFEIRYFINIAVHNRPEVRSKVVLAILEAFKEVGLRPPYTQQDTYIWDLHQKDDEKKGKIAIYE